MLYTFDQVSKDVVKKLQGKDLRPVRCLSDATKFRQFDILQKTPQSLFFKSEDTPVGYSLLQILEPNFPVPGIVSQGAEKCENQHFSVLQLPRVYEVPRQVAHEPFCLRAKDKEGTLGILGPSVHLILQYFQEPLLIEL